MKGKIIAIAAAIAITTFSGCASIVSHSNWPVTIATSPDGAAFTVTNQKTGQKISNGVTPTTITLPSSNGFFSAASYLIQFQKDGYDSQSFTLQAGMNGWYVGNIVFGGLIGWLIVDPATGAMWKLQPGVNLTLTAKTAALRIDAPSADGKTRELLVVTRDQVPADLADNLIRIN
ncbi:MAG: hypothetical protein Q7T36_06325 [Fluviicoccus sp.]|uniref:hypothetical protein n=1 Tax=Fluviicoccus sp. TaxID=2003552 RepID=UPI00272426A6|nr:hypothetical protein [Fluviicoccus sp.]MDO8330069.1 hypothetical protein [Fluviicoccus sp.]